MDRRLVYAMAAGLALGAAVLAMMLADGSTVPGIAGPSPASPSPSGDAPVSDRDTPLPPDRVTSTLPPGGGVAPGTTRVLAPIDGAQIAVLESFPPQYRLLVKAGLPNGCARAGGHEVTRSGNDIRVAVYNTMPAGNVACTQVYGNYDLSIDLGSAFTPGTEYRVDVNRRQLSFRAQ